MCATFKSEIVSTVLELSCWWCSECQTVRRSQAKSQSEKIQTERASCQCTTNCLFLGEYINLYYGSTMKQKFPPIHKFIQTHKPYFYLFLRLIFSLKLVHTKIKLFFINLKCETENYLQKKRTYITSNDKWLKIKVTWNSLKSRQLVNKSLHNLQYFPNAWCAN